MNTRRIGPFEVRPIGLGCMNLSHAYGTPPSESDAEALLLDALDQGVTLFDTAALYGFGANETLVGRVLKAHRQRIVLCSKGGMTGQPVGPGGALQRVIDGRPEAIRRDCDDSLRRLGTDHVDVYYLHRWDKKIPIEDSVGAMARLVEAGKVRAIGLSEVSAATLRRAHAVHPIAALQTEYSPCTRNPEIAVLQACSDIGAAVVAFSPVARAFHTGALADVSGLEAKDIRRSMPRFEPANHAANLLLLPAWQALAAEAGCTSAQLSLAWLLARGAHVIPIPGTTSRAHLRENLGAAAVVLSADLMARIDAVFHPTRIAGARYGAQSQVEVDTEQFGG
ncbi:MAG: aldo/keto reductase [Rubrivivax sp.]|nr:aldo/keto reductase [Rubrivivax sp.]